MTSERSRGAADSNRPVLVSLSKLAIPVLMAVLVVIVGPGAAAQSDDRTRPQAPVNIRLVSVANTSVKVAWDVVPAAEGQPEPEVYRVYYRTAAPEPGSQPVVARWWSWWGSSEVAATQRESTVPRLTRGVWYEVTVTAIDGAGTVWSDDSVSARPGSKAVDESVPRAPSKATVVAETPGSVSVAWEAPSDDGGAPVTGYEVWHIRRQHRLTDNSDEADAVVWTMSGETLGSDIRRYVIEGLVDYEEYYVVVAAVNRVGPRHLLRRTIRTARPRWVGPSECTD